jgi:hypothetical protein
LWLSGIIADTQAHRFDARVKRQDVDVADTAGADAITAFRIWEDWETGATSEKAFDCGWRITHP